MIYYIYYGYVIYKVYSYIDILRFSYRILYKTYNLGSKLINVVNICKQSTNMLDTDWVVL